MADVVINMNVALETYPAWNKIAMDEKGGLKYRPQGGNHEMSRTGYPILE
jgi:hypothetical protein